MPFLPLRKNLRSRSPPLRQRQKTRPHSRHVACPYRKEQVSGFQDAGQSFDHRVEILKIRYVSFGNLTDSLCEILSGNAGDRLLGRRIDLRQQQLVHRAQNLTEFSEKGLSTGKTMRLESHHDAPAGYAVRAVARVAAISTGWCP